MKNGLITNRFLMTRKEKSVADYIDREKLLKSIPRVKYDKTISLFGAVADMICIVNSVPKEDVAHVVHAKWNDHHCTACGCQSVTFKTPSGETIYVETPRCPECGAIMDIEQEEPTNGKQHDAE